LVAIPGSVGAAPIQNIGAYGVEAKDVIEEVHFWHLPSASMRSLTKTDCQFDYRNSIFKNELKDQCIITEVVFRLEKKADFKLGYGSLHAELVKRNIVSPSLKDIAEIIRTVRESKLPDVKEIGNAGSFFKNPIVSASHLKKLQTKYPNIVFYPLDNGEVKLAAGWLIEHAGLKGFQIGGAAVHEQQALVIINKNGATGPDVVALSTHIQKVILQLYDVQLSPEVIFV
jgi:UDP-N-acetylmuramate dehydrogenase